MPTTTPKHMTERSDGNTCLQLAPNNMDCESLICVRKCSETKCLVAACGRKQKGPLGPCPKTYACACANKIMFFLGQKQIGHTPVIPCTELGPKFLKTCPRALKNKLLAFFRKLEISSCYSARRAEARGPNIKCARATKTKTVGV